MSGKAHRSGSFGESSKKCSGVAIRCKVVRVGIWCMRGEGCQGRHLCPVLESNLRLTDLLPLVKA